ncbi:hypothetical protein J3R83DRAFT_3629 [Lanmaoa asiatica]|nr:hypothetical protein J3R83DRAFT_3629 [Lanmaoa asiatica]
MATVHPSRMGLVPPDPKDFYRNPRYRRSPSPSHRYDRDRRERDRERDRESDNDSERVRGWERPDDRRDRRRDRGNDRTSPGWQVDDRDNDRGRHRERSRDKDKDKDKDRSRSRRRASPEYGEYKRPASPGPRTPSMYPSRQPRDGAYDRRGGYGGGGEYLERWATLFFPSIFRGSMCAENAFHSRRAQREGSAFSIWPSSPKAPTRTLYVVISRTFNVPPDLLSRRSPERGSSRRKPKRVRSATPTESSDSESERRRRERKERKRARKEREKKERKEHRRRSRSYYESEEEVRPRERDRDRRSKSKSRPRSPSPSPVPSSSRMSEDEGEWVEKPAASGTGCRGVSE